MTLSQKFTLLHNFFMMLKSWKENLKKIVKGHTKNIVCTACGVNILKNQPEAAKVATLVKFFNVEKNLGIFPSSRF